MINLDKKYLPDHIQRLIDLLSENQNLIEFTKITPYGLVIESLNSMENILEIGNQPGYAVLGISSNTNILAAVPALVRLSVTRLEQLNLPIHFDDDFINELLWIYSFARAKKYFPKIEYKHLCKHVKAMWDKISEFIISDHQSLLNSLYVQCFSAYGHPWMDKVEAKFKSDISSEIWNLALESDSFKLLLGRMNLNVNSKKDVTFFSLENPRKRIVIHYSYGRRAGVAATDQGDFAKSVDELKYLAYWLSRNPLMFESHDHDLPIALVTNPHLRNINDRNEVIYESLIIDKTHWDNKEKFKGTSLGVYHE